MRRLRLERIPLYQLHRPDENVPYEESVGALVELQQQGKIQHIGVSNVDERLLKTAQKLTDVASVQNRYNFGDRESETMVGVCEREGMAFLPWAPIHDTPNGDSQRSRRVTTRRPGTSPEENVAAAGLHLDPDEVHYRETCDAEGASFTRRRAP